MKYICKKFTINHQIKKCLLWRLKCLLFRCRHAVVIMQTLNWTNQCPLFMTVRHIFEISEDDHPSLVTHARDNWWTLDFANAFVSPGVNRRGGFSTLARRFAPSARGLRNLRLFTRTPLDITRANNVKQSARLFTFCVLGQSECLKFEIYKQRSEKITPCSTPSVPFDIKLFTSKLTNSDKACSLL